MEPTTTTTQTSTAQAAQGAQTTTGQAATAAPVEYNVPDVVMQKYPDLVALIKKTESMSKDERNYWFQILPIMTDDQVARLRKILDDEASQLTKLDSEYQTELAKLNEKHLKEWDDFERTQKRDELKKVESASSAEEAKHQEDLLKQLGNL
jgi:hypothetical protein